MPFASRCETLQPRKRTENVAIERKILLRSPPEVRRPLLARLAPLMRIRRERGNRSLEIARRHDEVRRERDPRDDLQRDVRDAEAGARQHRERVLYVDVEIDSVRGRVPPG